MPFLSLCHRACFGVDQTTAVCSILVLKVSDVHNYTITATVVIYRSLNTKALNLVELLSESASTVFLVDNTPVPLLSSAEVAELLPHNVAYVPTRYNGGYGYGHNQTIPEVAPDPSHLHVVVNPDVEIATDTLTRLARYFDDPRVGLLMPHVTYPDGTPQQLARRVPSPVDVLRRMIGPYLHLRDGQFELAGLDWEVDNEVPVVSGCFMMMRGSVLRLTGPFDERFFMYFEDYDLSRRFASVSTVISVASPTIIHDYGRGSRYSARMALIHLTSAFRYFQKWGWILDPERATLNRKIGPYKRYLP